MTKTVKKRLQAVVALLVTLMIMVGIMPHQPFNTTANAAGYQFGEGTTIYFNASECNATEGNWTGATGISVNLYAGSDHWVGMSKDTSITNKNIFKYTFTSTTGAYSVTKLKFRCDGGYSGYNISNFTGDTNSCAMTEGPETYRCKNNVGNVMSISIADTTYHVPPDPKAGTRSMLVGVNYYNYFYDEQVAYTGGDPSGMSITQGQQKNPYTYFNAAVSASPYGQNVPLPMYIGEFWVGGNAESGGSEENPSSTYNPNLTQNPNYQPTVSAGKKERTVGVHNGSANISPNSTLHNFNWSANLAFRGNGEAAYHVVAQGLIDSTLDMNPASEYYLTPTVTVGNTKYKLPYFDSSFLYSNSTASGKDVGHVYTSTFPLYRRSVSLDKNSGFSDSGSWDNGYLNDLLTVPSTDSTTTITDGTTSGKLQCYTFNSKEDTVRVNPDGGMSEDSGTSVAGGASGANAALSTLDGADVDDGATTLNIPEEGAKYVVNGVLNVSNYIGAFNAAYGTSLATDTTIASAGTTIYNTKGSMFDAADMYIMEKAGIFSNSGGHVKDVDGQNGFFPFNDSGDGTKALQYGFATRLDIKFNITADGTDKNGAPMIFRFSGDDDVWVFIDGQLVLDMGGGHKDAVGEINFQNGKTAVMYAADATAAPNDIWQPFSGNQVDVNVQSTAFQSQINAIKAEADGTHGTGKQSEKNISGDHILTMFYMERGKLNSNMSLMFNFDAPEVVDIPEKFPETPEELTQYTEKPANKFTVQEVTTFNRVNPGLIAKTKEAAENDVFYYVMKADNTDTTGTGDSGILFPNEYTGTRGTNQLVAPTTITRDTGNIYLDVSGYRGTANYFDSNKIVAWYKVNLKSGSTTATSYYVARAYENPVDGAGGHIYKFKCPIGETGSWNIQVDDQNTGTKSWTVQSIAYVKFYSLDSTKSGQQFTNLSYGGSSPCNDSNSQNYFVYTGNTTRKETKSFSDAVASTFTFTGTDTDGKYNVTSDGVARPTNQSSRNWDRSDTIVDNVSYIWQDDKATTTNSPMTNSTTGAGSFGLMYGTVADADTQTALSESKAVFKNQLALGKNVQVQQSDLLFTPNGTASSSDSGAWMKTTATSAGGRSAATYYTTTKSVKDMNTLSNVPIGTGKLVSTDTNDSADIFTYATASSTNVDYVETFANDVNVGSVTISKTVTGAATTTGDLYKVNVKFENVLGISGVDVIDYSHVTISGDAVNNLDTLVNGVNGSSDTGYFFIAQNATVTIAGIPVGTQITITEDVAAYQSVTYDTQTGNFTTTVSTHTIGTDSNNDFYNSSGFGTVTIGGSSGNSFVINTDGATGVFAVSNPAFNNTPPFNPTHIHLVLRKQWVNMPSENAPTTITFVVERKLATDADWTEVEEVSLTTANRTSDTSVVIWEGVVGGNSSFGSQETSIKNMYVDAYEEGNYYYYRIREKSAVGDIISDGGCYALACQVEYDGGDNGALANSLSTIRSGSTDYANAMALKATNTYSQLGFGQPLPKTGARGVYAIVTFGAFAITIAGVALLIYRKKLQTVNIYAVKGSGKKEE